ncbi:MAG TPA: ATP-binding protein [Pirellulales bacterium]|nr:ATP-binding protein [Pirellulales bacterium]
MSMKPQQTDLSHRAAHYFLAFGLLAVASFLAGLPTISRSVLAMQTESACVTRLGKAAHLVLSCQMNDTGGELQSLVERLASEGNLVYCAVVSPQGRFLAHSLPGHLGETAGEPEGATAQWGDVRRVRFVDADSRILREYSTSLKRGEQPLGVLRMAVHDPSLVAGMLAAAEHAPLVVLGPVAVIAVGAVALRRTLQPVCEVESQLRAAASTAAGSPLSVGPTAATHPIATGWNRVVSELGLRAPQPSLDDRLGHVLEAFRQRKSEQILNSLPYGVAVTDPEGRISFANQALGALLGWPDRPLTGRTMVDCLGLDTTANPENALLDPELHLRDVVIELGRSGDTSQGVLRIARYPLRGDAGASQGHVWSVRDVTQQKLADQMRNQFVYSATHELRTPLANIKAYAETLALTDVLDVERQKEFCNIINAEATRLARLIDDLLSISRMQSGSMSLERQWTDVERLVRETIEHVRPQMAQKQIAFDAALPDKLPELSLDKDKIAVALVNLLGNATKYTPQGGRVGLSLEVRNDQLSIHVEDSGIGISVEDLSKLFDKFYRSNDPRVQEQPGSGLGLSLTHEIVRLHGGKLSVQSELDKGSKFTLVLPLK